MTVKIFKNSLQVIDDDPETFVVRFGGCPDKPLEEIAQVDNLLSEIVKATAIMSDADVITPFQRLAIIDATLQCITSDDSPTGSIREIPRQPRQPAPAGYFTGKSGRA